MAFIAVAAVVAACATLSAFSGIARGNAVSAAIASGWAGGKVYGDRADQLYWLSQKNPPWPQVLSLTRRALKDAPLSPRSLALLGYHDTALGNHAAAARVMTLALKLSRRDFATHLWLIEYFARRGDVEGVLHHYDLALRTKSDASTVMFPPLTKALSAPDIGRAFARYVRERPFWLVPALNYIATHTDNPGELAEALKLGGGLPAGQQYRNVESMMIGQLLQKQGPRAAAGYYLALPDADPSLLRRVNFMRRNIDPQRAPIAWGAIVSPDASGSFVPDKSPGTMILEGSVAPRSKGLLARKLLFLSPGRYRLAAQGELAGGEGAALQTVLSCAAQPSAGVLVRQSIGGGGGRASFVVEPDCPAQFLDIAIDAGTGPEAAEGRVNSLDLEAVR